MLSKNTYFVYAYPGSYGGNHGMYDYELATQVDFDEACEIGLSLAIELVNTYLRPEDNMYTREDYMEEHFMEEWDERFEDDYYNCLDDIILDEAEYEVYHVKDGTSLTDYDRWERNDGNPRNFIRDYCEEP